MSTFSTVGTIKTRIELGETTTETMVRVDKYRERDEGEPSSSSRLVSGFDSEKLDLGA